MNILSTPYRGAIAYCSSGFLGLILSSEPVPVKYASGDTGLAWTGIHISPDKFGEAWSSRKPRVASSFAELEAFKKKYEKAAGQLDIIKRSLERDDDALLANDYGGTGWELEVPVRQLRDLIDSLAEPILTEQEVKSLDAAALRFDGHITNGSSVEVRLAVQEILKNRLLKTAKELYAVSCTKSSKFGDLYENVQSC